MSWLSTEIIPRNLQRNDLRTKKWVQQGDRIKDEHTKKDQISIYKNEQT